MVKYYGNSFAKFINYKNNKGIKTPLWFSVKMKFNNNCILLFFFLDHKTDFQFTTHVSIFILSY
ncbi:hypothetical protein B0E34_20315 [Chryseobacterium mucoviscidosis]|uniref:Uncharacterized protein n=1 Tax=Chryseobacterium mucoviscidosis TaxID=1945581 RepID=A0A202BR81_9FLAO|nr:hypothetical protein B0E34_20315 [Chryseobacterium mucoviscidosis]